jgi:hypothetical protein
MFNDQLKRLYNVDKQLKKLKSEKKELLRVIHDYSISRQGRYILVNDAFNVRIVDIEKYRKAVTEEEFNQSIIIPIRNAEKYLTADELLRVIRTKRVDNIYVIKE